MSCDLRQRRVIPGDRCGDIAGGIACDDEINAEQAVGRGAHCDILQSFDAVPLIERGLFR